MDKQKSIKSIGYRLTLLGSCAIVLSACAKPFSQRTENLAQSITNQVACTDFKSQLWTELYKIAEDGEGFPVAEDLQAELSKRLQTQVSDPRQKEEIEKLAKAASTLYASIVNEVSADPSASKDDVVKKLISVELQDEETESLASTKVSVEKGLATLKELAQELSKTSDLSCVQMPSENAESGFLGTEASVEGVMLDTWKKNLSLPVYGAYKSMATAYQSCNTMNVEALDLDTPDVAGITIRCETCTEARGRWREVTSANHPKFIKSHPYLNNNVYRMPASDGSCFDTQAKPMIYDFGGKPQYSDTSYYLNFFENRGSGATNMLGIDCSGLIVSSYLTAGLKLNSTEAQRPSYVVGVPARAFMNPAGSSMKLSCFDYIPVNDATALKPGDTFASTGHIVMVDKVRQDPFGIASITSKSSCTTANISSSRYNFTIVQSSPVKGGIGIDRIEARAYFNDSGSMSTAMKEYAVAACKAKFGETSKPTPSGARMVRHKGTAACMDKAVPIKKSSCLASCPASTVN